MATVELEIEESALVVAALNEDDRFDGCKPSEMVKAMEVVLENHCHHMVNSFGRWHGTSIFMTFDSLADEVADQIRADRILGDVRTYR